MDKKLAQLEQTVQQQITANERMLTIVAQKLEAFRRADREALAACCQRENEQFQQVAELEKKRLLLVAELTQLVDPQAQRPLSMGELAERLPEPARGRLLVLRQTLRQRLEKVQREGSVARRAAESLLRHMQGIVQTIGGALTGIGTYGQRGKPPAAAMRVSTFVATG